MRTTRWQGIATANGFVAQAWATARTAFGRRCVGELGIAHRRPARNGAQRLPDALLERRAAHVERQIEPHARRLHQAHDSGDQSLEPASPPISSAFGKRS